MNVELPISIAREMYKSGNEKLFNFAKKYYLTDDLEFKPKFGDIIANDKIIVVLDVINKNGDVIPIIYYDIIKDKLKYKDNDILFNIGDANSYKFATNDEKYFFFSKIKKQLQNNK